MTGIRVGVITVSDKSSRGERADTGGPSIGEALATANVMFDQTAYLVVPDEQAHIESALRQLAARVDVDVIFTTGGTGLAPRDVTPQATRAVIDYEIPGIAEVMRATSVQVTPAGMLSRALAGVIGRTLVINLPGNPKAVRETIPSIAGALAHAVSTLAGSVGEHSRPEPEQG